MHRTPSLTTIWPSKPLHINTTPTPKLIHTCNLIQIFSLINSLRHSKKRNDRHVQAYRCKFLSGAAARSASQHLPHNSSSRPRRLPNNTTQMLSLPTTTCTHRPRLATHTNLQTAAANQSTGTSSPIRRPTRTKAWAAAQRLKASPSTFSKRWRTVPTSSRSWRTLRA